MLIILPYAFSSVLQDCNSINTVRCPAGACCVGGQTGCGINECSDPQCCNSVEPDCSNLSNIRVQGRECAQSCTTTDPLYEPANFGVYSRWGQLWAQYSAAAQGAGSPLVCVPACLCLLQCGDEMLNTDMSCC